MIFNNTNESEFNSGLAIIYQLDGIERAMGDATEENNYEKHFRCLLVYFKTLYPHMNPAEKQFHYNQWNEIKKNYQELINARKLGKKSVSTSIVDSFQIWEIQLRETKQKHGLGMPEKDKRYQPYSGKKF